MKQITPEQRTEWIMKQLHISRQELSETLGVSLSSVAMYFSGYHRIRRVVALAIQASYGISADWLMYDKKPRFIKKPDEKISDEAMEIAIMYNLLPKKLQEVADTMMSGLQKL